MMFFMRLGVLAFCPITLAAAAAGETAASKLMVRYTTNFEGDENPLS
jgi:hypothetical protein